MKIRYYLRGLGLGILFTAVFFLISEKSEPTMSDAMIKERARELGMIENTVLADIGASTDMETDTGNSESVLTETVEESTEMATEDMLETADADSVTEPEGISEEEIISEETPESEVTSEEETAVEELTNQEEPEETSEESISTGQMISIIVNKGEGSDTVSRRLYDAGLIEDSYEYDRYLMENGYDKRIGAGEHLIPEGAGWQEIAQILTN